MKRITKNAALNTTSHTAKGATTKSVEVSSKVQGEGDYESAQRYSESVHSFVESGKVTQAAEKAEPETPQVQQELQKAERVGESHSKGEDPGVKRKSRGKP